MRNMRQIRNNRETPSAKRGAEGALAGAMNGVFQAAGGAILSKAGTAIGMSQAAVENIVVAEKYIKGVNVSYSKDDGWGVKANVSGLVQSLGMPNTALNDIAKNFTNVTIGQSQHGGASLNLGYNTGAGNVGLTYTGATGDWEGSYDFIERDYNGIKLSSEISYGKDGFTLSGEADFGNGYGLGVENGKSGVSASLTILGSQQGSVDRYGNYTPNENFLGEINGQDVYDLIQSQKKRLNSADADNPNDSGDSPSGLVDLAFAAGTFLMSAGAAFVAGGGSSAPSGGSSAGNGAYAGNSVVGKRPEDEEGGGEGGCLVLK